MDIDVFPNSIEYWGPNGMVFFRNVSVRWMPIRGDTRLTFAAERPGATADAGPYTERVELMDIIARFPIPDFSGEFRWAGKHGYAKLSGIVRYIKWDDLGTDGLDLSGSEIGWGVNGAASVCASVLAVVIAIGAGISAAFWTGTACYAVALGAGYVKSQAPNPELQRSPDHQLPSQGSETSTT